MQSRKLALLIALLALRLANLSYAAPTQPSPLKSSFCPITKMTPVSSQVQDDVRETVIRYYIPKYRADVLFVSVIGQPTSTGLLQRFKKSKKIVRSLSQGLRQPSQGGDPWRVYYIDKATKRKGGLLNIGPLMWQSASKVQVVVDNPGSGDRLTLVRKGTSWAVIKKDMAWIN